ncbi:MAG: hypothetical protein ACR2L6_10670 [Gemmatimonadaceae bacterium]
MTDTRPEPQTSGGSRSQNVVRVLPRDWSSLAEVITPSMERIDSTAAATQFLVVTPDPASTFAVVRGAFERFGTVGIDLFPATAEHRAARMMAGVPVPAVAGPPVVLRALVSRSVLRLDGIKSVLFAWIEEVIESGGDQLAALEAILAELPDGVGRTLVVREVTPAVQGFIDRYMFRARRVVPAAADSEDEETQPMAMEYVTTPSAARPASLWRLLDELDPPSAVIVARHPESEADARRTLSQLGYRRADDAVRVSSVPAGENVHTIIFYDAPLSAADIEAARAVTAARVIAFVEGRDVDELKQLSGGLARPLAVSDAVRVARRKDDTLRAELKQVLDEGVAFREMTSLEPLLEQYDAVEIAAALLRVLESERARSIAVPAAPKPARPGPGLPPDRGPRPGSPRPDRRPPAADRGGPPRGREDRPPRSRDDRPPRGRDDRPPRGREDRPPRGREDRPPPRGGPPRDPGRYGSRDSGRGGPPRGGPPRGRGGDRGGSRR